MTARDSHHYLLIDLDLDLDLTAAVIQLITATRVGGSQVSMHIYSNIRGVGGWVN